MRPDSFRVDGDGGQSNFSLEFAEGNLQLMESCLSLVVQLFSPRASNGQGMPVEVVKQTDFFDSNSGYLGPDQNSVAQVHHVNPGLPKTPRRQGRPLLAHLFCQPLEISSNLPEPFVDLPLCHARSLPTLLRQSPSGACSNPCIGWHGKVGPSPPAKQGTDRLLLLSEASEPREAHFANVEECVDESSDRP